MNESSLRSRVKALVDKTSINKAAKLIGVSRQSLGAFLAAQPIRAGTKRMIEDYVLEAGTAGGPG